MMFPAGRIRTKRSTDHVEMCHLAVPITWYIYIFEVMGALKVNCVSSLRRSLFLPCIGFRPAYLLQERVLVCMVRI